MVMLNVISQAKTQVCWMFIWLIDLLINAFFTFLSLSCFFFVHSINTVIIHVSQLTDYWLICVWTSNRFYSFIHAYIFRSFVHFILYSSIHPITFAFFFFLKSKNLCASEETESEQVLKKIILTFLPRLFILFYINWELSFHVFQTLLLIFFTVICLQLNLFACSAVTIQMYLLSYLRRRKTCPVKLWRR